MEPVVYVLDDDPAVRQGVCQLLKSAQINSLSCASLTEFMTAYNPMIPGCMVLDVRMPDMSGMDLQAKLSADNLKIPIVFITGYGDVPMAVKAIKRGAVDFLQKPFRDEELLDAVRKAIAANTHLRQINTEKKLLAGKMGLLSDREKQIMGLIVLGQPNKVIASQLNISEKTVEFHRSHLMHKLQCGSVVELVRLSIRADQLLG